MKPLESYIKPNIRALTPYATARDDCAQRMDVYLDANENPYDNGFNRYPSPHQPEIKAVLARIKGVEPSRIFLGNGSDEAIDLIFRLFCESGRDSVVIMSPSYGMYTVAAQINDVEIIPAPLNAQFQVQADDLLARVRPDTKVIFLCSPNNPTGNLLNPLEVEKIVTQFDGIVVIDEAYIDFAPTAGWVPRLASFPRLVVLQTLSKAWGMAGVRLGMALADPVIINAMNRVKYPYNINVLTQRTVLRELGREEAFRAHVQTLCQEREALATALSALPNVITVYPSDANFLLVRFAQHHHVFEQLWQAGIVVRDRSSVPLCQGCLRVSVGTPSENQHLLAVLRGSNTRTAFLNRTTRETSIRVALDLDAPIAPRIDTGLKFFDHMLEQIGYHGAVGLTIEAVGDLETDAHHTVEDTAIALGDALRQALGHRKGIERYGFALPMDESQATVLLDLGGRIAFAWDVTFREATVGQLSTSLFVHFFDTLAQHLQANLHVSARGTNDHHLIEAVFKAFARALKAALRKDELNAGVPSSKGVL